MKRLFCLFAALLAQFSKGQDSKLGAEADPIRRMLFASQTLQEQLAQMHPSGEAGSLQDIADAAMAAKSGKREEAVAKLKHALEAPDNETRVVLWAWAGLRELGVQPDRRLGGEVLGAVIEMPMNGGYDTLAAYTDGSARYLNYSGKAIFWDRSDERIKALCQALIDSTIPASGKAQPRKSTALPKSGAQVTMLTRSGNFVIMDPPQSVVNAGATLMITMMNRVKQGESSSSPPQKD